MRLISHNLLSCHVKTCKPPTNFPLLLRDITKIETQETEVNELFLRNFYPKVDWPALRDAARSVRCLSYFLP